MNYPESITIDSFCDLLGITSKELPQSCINFINNNDFDYRIVENDEREKLLLKALKRFDTGKLSISGKIKKDIWKKGWDENLEEFLISGNLEHLIPKFVRKCEPLRLNGKDYIHARDPNIETNFVTLLRLYLFEKYFYNIDVAYEFGCGTGLNLIALAKLYPKMEINGFDWVSPSIEILTQLRKKFGYNLNGYLFDMFHPNMDFEIKPRSGLFTIGAMEQLGNDYKEFLNFILHKKPSVIINIETIYELYNSNSIFDYVSKRYLEKRNWLRGYYSDLLDLKEKGQIEILDVQRPFGSFYHDGYSFIVWKVKT